MNNEKLKIISDFMELLANMSEDEREEAMNIITEKYCVHCMSDTLPCHCWNDE